MVAIGFNIFGSNKRNMSDIRPVNISTLNSLIESTEYSSVKSIENADVFTAINTIAGDISALPIRVTDKTYNSNASIEYMLNTEPNSIVNGKDFMYIMVTSTILNGNAYAHIIRDNVGLPESLHFISNDRIKAIKKKSSKDHVVELEYEISQFGNNSKTTKIKSQDILHIKPFSLDGIIGKSPLIALKEDIESTRHSKRFFTNFFRNGTQAGGTIKVAGDLNSDDKEAVREAWQEANSGTDQAHKIIVLDDSTTYTPIKVDTEILKLINDSKHNTIQVAKVLGMPLHKMKLETHSVSLEQANSDYVINTLNSYINAFESELNRKLFTDKDMRQNFKISFDTDMYKFADAKTKHDTVRAKYELGVISLNESRIALGHPPIEGGDRYIQSLNYMNSELVDDYQLKKAGANPNIDTSFVDNDDNPSQGGEK